jgi:ribosomal protein S18 acetylase RimI-like enzyme
VLDVMTKDTAAIRLYERLGWQKIGEASHHFGDGQRTAALCFVSPEAGY